MRQISCKGRPKFRCIDQVAVAWKGGRAQTDVDKEPLDVTGLIRSRRGVTVVADRTLNGNSLRDRWDEHLAHQAQVLVQPDLGSIAASRIKT